MTNNFGLYIFEPLIVFAQLYLCEGALRPKQSPRLFRDCFAATPALAGGARETKSGGSQRHRWKLIVYKPYVNNPNTCHKMCTPKRGDKIQPFGSFVFKR
jgi:hypothetical protein